MFRAKASRSRSSDASTCMASRLPDSYLKHELSKPQSLGIVFLVLLVLYFLRERERERARIIVFARVPSPA